MKLKGRETGQSSGRQRHADMQDIPKRQPGFAYRARRSEEKSNLGRKTDRIAVSASQLRSTNFWVQRFGLIILLVAIVTSSVNILSLSKTADIRAVAGSDVTPQFVNQSQYQAVADHILAESIWNQNKITINTEEIRHQLLAKFPELTSVSVTIPPLTHRPIVYVEPAQAVLIIQSASSGAFVLDTNGKALLNYDQNSPNEPKTALPVITDLSGLKLVLGRQVLSATSVDFVRTVVGQLTAKHYQITSMTLPPEADELDVALAGQPYTVKFNLQNNDPQQQAGTFLATIASLKTQSITPAQYIDVRVDGRAYYK